jgi:riboflavin kinase / FMN adenylyltransferase
LLKIVGLNEFVTGEEQISLSLGFFDGVHVGHQEIIINTVVDARLKGRRSAIFTFYEHPLKIICPVNDPPKLTTIEEKQAVMSDLGMDYFIWADFDDRFCKISPDRFVKEILIQKIGVKAVFAGPNYSFGFKAEGTPQMLVDYGRMQGFEANILPPIMFKDKMISSTLVREIVSGGDLVKASHLLGRYYMITGRASQKRKEGESEHSSGLPVEYPREKVMPKHGAYAVYFTMESKCHRGLCHVHDTTAGPSAPQELSIFPLGGELHFQDPAIQVHFLESIGDEGRLSSPSGNLHEERDKAELVFSRSRNLAHMFIN